MDLPTFKQGFMDSNTESANGDRLSVKLSRDESNEAVYFTKPKCIFK